MLGSAPVCCPTQCLSRCGDLFRCHLVIGLVCRGSTCSTLTCSAAHPARGAAGAPGEAVCAGADAGHWVVRCQWLTPPLQCCIVQAEAAPHGYHCSAAPGLPHCSAECGKQVYQKKPHWTQTSACGAYVQSAPCMCWDGSSRSGSGDALTGQVCVACVVCREPRKGVVVPGHCCIAANNLAAACSASHRHSAGTAAAGWDPQGTCKVYALCLWLSDSSLESVGKDQGCSWQRSGQLR